MTTNSVARPKRSREITAAICGVAVMLVSAAGTYAQQSSGSLAELADQLEATIDQLDPAKIPTMQMAAERVVEASKAVDREFSSLGGESHATAWLEYLNLQPLLTAIDDIDLTAIPKSRSERSQWIRQRAPLVEAIHSLLARITINYPGLERPSIAQLRAATRQLDLMMLYHNPETAIRGITEAIKDSATLIRQSDGNSTAALLAQLSKVARYLDEAKQSPETVQAIRDQFDQPNLKISAGSDLIERLVGRPFVEPSPVNECLLGTRVRGTAELRGTVSSTLIQSQGVGTIHLLLDGTVTSRNRGFRFPVTVDANAYGTVTATKVLEVSDDGLKMQPSVVRAELDSKIRRVNHPLRIVRRLALKEAHKQKPLSNAIGARRLERRVAEDFDRQVEETNPLGVGKNTPVKDLLTILERMGIDEPQRTWESDPRYLSTEIFQQDSGQLGAQRAPAAPSLAHTMAFQVHESMVYNTTTTIFSNRRVTGRQVENVIRSVFPDFEMSKSDQADNGDPDSVVITFARQRPVIFEARNGELTIGIRGTHFAYEDQELNAALQVTARYQGQSDGDKRHLQRLGEVEIEMKSNLGAVARIAVREKMILVFSRIFPERILDQPIPLPLKQFPDTQVQAHELRAENGWLTVGLQ